MALFDYNRGLQINVGIIYLQQAYLTNAGFDSTNIGANSKQLQGLFYLVCTQQPILAPKTTKYLFRIFEKIDRKNMSTGGENMPKEFFNLC